MSSSFFGPLFDFLYYFSIILIVFIIGRYIFEREKADKIIDDEERAKFMKLSRSKYINMGALIISSMASGWVGNVFLSPGDLMIGGEVAMRADQKSSLLALIVAAIVGIFFWVFSLIILRLSFKAVDMIKRQREKP